MVDKKEQPRKQASMGKRIKRFFVPEQGKDPHKLYPDEYFRRFWFNRQDSRGFKIVADVEEIPQKAAAHLIFELGFKRWMGQKVKEHMDAMDTPEGRQRTRFIMTMRRLARERGWDINKIL